MKKNIVIIILAVTTVLSLMYAFVQKNEADRQREIALRNMEMARAQMVEAQQQRELAQQQGIVLSKALENTQEERAKAKD